MEAAYEFRRRRARKHRPDLADPVRPAMPKELAIEDGWRVLLDGGCGPAATHAAHDLVDFLAISLGVRVSLQELPSGQEVEARTITLRQKGPGTPGERDYVVDVLDDRILLAAGNDWLLSQACYHLEHALSLRCAAAVPRGRQVFTQLFERWTHSGWGVDEFPDEELALIARAGIDNILVFVVGPDELPGAMERDWSGYRFTRSCDLSALAKRCEKYGLGTYLYSLMDLDLPHPGDAGAQAAYDEAYGSLFRACPEARGIVLVGESVEFRSRDPHVGRRRLDPDARRLPDPRPSPGWWPCEDYPQWAERVRDAIRRYRPDADIVLWTYNWGWAPEADRLALIEALPTDITLCATFEMFESMPHDGVRNRCVDYTASNVGPGSYFSSEAVLAHRRGIRLAAQANTLGLSWDFGMIPYQPIPWQWNERHTRVRAAGEDWGLAAVMENHHYGWWPSFVAEMTRWNYTHPAPDIDWLLEAMARRDFGAGAGHALAAWRLFSEANRHYVSTDADQYGPCRIGPAFPITLGVPPKPVSDWEAMSGEMIVKVPYAPDAGVPGVQTAPGPRVRGEQLAFERMAELWAEGVKELRAAVDAAPVRLLDEACRSLRLAEYVSAIIATTLHCKRWWRAQTKLLVEEDRQVGLTLLDELVEIGEAELGNCAAAIPLLEGDSRLGWEPSMGYLGDAEHVRWKVAHLRHSLEYEIPRYRETLCT